MTNTFRILFTVLLFLNVGCFNDGPDCGPFATTYINIEGLSGSNVAVGNSYANFVSLGEGATVAFTEFGIRATPEATVSEMASAGGYQAVACSPVPPQPTEEIAEIAVFSSAEYKQEASDKVFSAGDTLNSIIKIYEPFSGRIVSLPDFLVDDDLAAYDDAFTLQLTTAPAEPTEHQFTVHYRLENGEFYQFTTSAVIVTS